MNLINTRVFKPMIPGVSQEVVEVLNGDQVVVSN